jgi:hypothetical protein
MDEDLVGMGEGSTDDNVSFLSCASEELDGSESDSSENSNESDESDDNDDNDDDDDYNDDDDDYGEYWEASRSNSDRHLAKCQ